MPTLNPLGFNQAKIASLFTTAKAQLTTITTDVTTLQADLLTMENLRLQLQQYGGNAAAEWLRIQLSQLPQGFYAYIIPGGTPILAVSAVEPGTSRDLSRLGDVRPVSAFDPSLT